MAIKRMSPQQREQGEGENHSGEAEREARRAPPEEREGAASNNQNSGDDGRLKVDTGQLKIPQDLTEEEEEVKRFLPADPAVLIIICLSLIFIAAIAYVIWNGWEPPQR
jgi:hypothetical protein